MCRADEQHDRQAPRRHHQLRLPAGRGGHAPASRQRRVLHRRRALRPDERPDVGRPAPAVEGRPRRLARAAEVGAPLRPDRRRRRHRRHHAPRARDRRTGLPGRAVRHQSGDGGGGPQASGRGAVGRARRLRHRQCRGAAVPRQVVRRLHDRLRHPQRHAHRPGARRSLSRAQDRRALSVPGVLGLRGAAARPPLRLPRLRDHPAPGGSWPRAPPSPTAIWSKASASSRPRSRSPQ